MQAEDASAGSQPHDAKGKYSGFSCQQEPRRKFSILENPDTFSWFVPSQCFICCNCLCCCKRSTRAVEQCRCQGRGHGRSPAFGAPGAGAPPTARRLELMAHDVSISIMPPTGLPGFSEKKRRIGRSSRCLTPFGEAFALSRRPPAVCKKFGSINMENGIVLSGKEKCTWCPFCLERFFHHPGKF